MIDGTKGFYASTIAGVAKTGFNVNPKFSILATLGMAPIAWTALQWATYSCEQAGEIKSARSFKINRSLWWARWFAFRGFYLRCLAWAEQRLVGTQFLSSAAAGYYGAVGPGLGSIQPFPNILAISMTAAWS